MSKLTNFPPVYFVSLEDSKERQNIMNQQLDLLGITDRTMVLAYDGRKVNYQNNELVEGLYFSQMDSGQIAVVMSHLRAIKEWYYKSTTPHAVFFEDDMTLQSSQFWAFDWNEFMNRLPPNWKAIQLSLIKEDAIADDDMQFKKRKWWNWSAGAYMLTREYAKCLIDEFCPDDNYTLRINKDLRLIPLIENVIYITAGDDVYTFPLFAENVNLSSTFFPDFIDNTHKGKQKECAEFVINWWKQWGKSINIESLIPKQQDELSKLLYEYVQDPEDPECNFKLGVYYENQGQTATAISYYLRTAERTNDNLLSYECLLRASICFDKQGTRNFTVKGLLQHAVALEPKRPEGYFLLSRYYERKEEWHDCFMIASVGDKVSLYNNQPLRTWVDYPGDYGILFQKAISSWWCGLCDESKKLLLNLKKDYDLNQHYLDVVNNNLQRIGKS